MSVEHWYRVGAGGLGPTANKLRLLKAVSPLVGSLDVELCFNVELRDELSEDDQRKLRWILEDVFRPELLARVPHLVAKTGHSVMIEIGPRLNFSTAFSSNAVSICQVIGLSQVTRLELSTRYLVTWQESGLSVSPATEDRLTAVLHDHMTQTRYRAAIASFRQGIKPEPWFHVDVMARGRQALEEVNATLGLAFDDWDLDLYTEMFCKQLGRNPTSVECFDLAQSNSEHSRHWFFKGEMVIDGQRKKDSLFDMIVKTQDSSNQNNIIKFSDNSSALRGFSTPQFRPLETWCHSPLATAPSLEHLIFTAETHNFPTGVAPFSGATTGTGGRLRDVQAVGRGGNYIAGTAGYCVGNLHVPGYRLPWEPEGLPHPPTFARPLDILIEASNGASDYGNKFGEPLICGFVRSFGHTDLSGERREWIKPVMFSGGVGSMPGDGGETKRVAQRGWLVVKLGGPAYRIGVGGGAASSTEVQGGRGEGMDEGAVQRGDAQMEQKMNRVIRACVERGQDNPIQSIHDQGAGGNGNVLKELVEPCGAVIFTRAFQLGDPSLSTLELWGAEYQENNAVLLKPEDEALVRKMADRERCPMCVVGTVIDSGRVILSEEEDMSVAKYLDGSYKLQGTKYPVDLDLEMVLGKMPRKVFTLERSPVIVQELSLPAGLTVMGALQRVLALPSVGSKRYLVNKVDRCVTGLIARQQCVGPLHTPLADVAVVAVSLFDTVGVATSIGEQPIKGLINPGAGARMTVAEALSNLVFAKISDLKDVKCSGNWMWAAKLPGEGAALYDACTAMCEVMAMLGIAVDGGKDSLSMAARVGRDTVKAPGSLVVSCYAPCPDIRLVLTPDLKGPSLGRDGALILVDLSAGASRLGGSALAQCYQQLGHETPDLDQPDQLRKAFNVTQELIQGGLLMSGHDVSDGGLVTCLVEMSIAGISGLSVDVTHKRGSPLEVLFSEEVGWVLETSLDNLEPVIQAFTLQGVPCHHIGHSRAHGINSPVNISVNKELAVESRVISLLRWWEETSFQLELLQADPSCVREEMASLEQRKAPQYRLTFDPDVDAPLRGVSVHVAVLREEGSNGDREMSAVLHKAGFTVWDVNTQDLISGAVCLDRFRGIVFPGGFSYADVLGAARGWAASLLLHEDVGRQLKAFKERTDTWSLGVCNGCQLMSRLGWLDSDDIELAPNTSARFECRWSSVRIQRSRAIMLQGMDGCVLGIWSAHGEGRFSFRDSTVLPALDAAQCCPMRYVDDDRNPTEHYPFNPNGSPSGLAAVCSQDGRHLAMMPHPERCHEMWQWPWKPEEWKNKVSPWQRMFRNAFSWSLANAF